jgi:hypothetical protein
MRHGLVLAEVKRDNADATKAINYQVKPMLDFAVRDDCVALYWDDIQQRVFWRSRDKRGRTEHEGPLTDLPSFGAKPGAVIAMVALYEKLVELDVPAMVHVSAAVQPALPHDQLAPPGRDTTAAGRHDAVQHALSPRQPVASPPSGLSATPGMERAAALRPNPASAEMVLWTRAIAAVAGYHP